MFISKNESDIVEDMIKLRTGEEHLLPLQSSLQLTAVDLLFRVEVHHILGITLLIEQNEIIENKNYVTMSEK